MKYHVEGGWGALRVDQQGGIRLWRPLDRENEGGAVSVARMVAVDEGHPPLSSTATLTLTLADVNDCPPTLLPPTVLHVMEASPPVLLGVLRATDQDVWAKGHGPPFTFTLDPDTPTHVADLISLKFSPREYLLLLASSLLLFLHYVVVVVICLE